MSDGAAPRPFKVTIHRCTQADYDAYEMKTKPEKMEYTKQQRFEHYKRYKGTAEFLVKKQKLLINKIKRGKFKEAPVSQHDMILVMAQHDLKRLEKTNKEFDEEISKLRREIHEASINTSR